MRQMPWHNSEMNENDEENKKNIKWNILGKKVKE